MIVRTLIQWHTEKDGVITWHEPGEIADIPDSYAPDLLPGRTVELLTEDEAKAWLAAQADPAPTTPVKGGRRGTQAAPPEPTEGSATT